MLPADRMRLQRADAVFVPGYLGPEDHPWLTALLDELGRFSGRRLREWQARCSEPLRAACPDGKLRMATWVLDRLCERQSALGPLPSREVRQRVFGEAQRRRSERRFQREQLLADVGADLGVEPDRVVEQLFADIPAEQRIIAPDPLPGARDLALRLNQALAQGLLRSASAVQIELGSNSRPVLRQLQLKRLLCTVRP